ncbi:phage tail protein [Pectobacterium aquaticum]|uniref:phage tail protein n=1 Tax=Pectobacterium aquaticum TaxID=2204145 RepID=UPI000E22CE48|nr:phage tail protein [Pectobacterium aquaticum]UEM37997.1 tail fiber protein [Pectobacterium aquaticum]
MANLSENPQWVDGIYQIETSDPVVGGPDGVSNRQAKELASRTRYLKKEQEKTGSDLATHAAAADPHTQYAPKDNPTFTGTPKAPTPATDSNSQQVATTAFVKSVVAALINGAPAALDTLQELAKSLGNDPSFSATVLNAIADVKTEAANKLNTHNSAADPHTQYAPKASPALTGKPTAPTAAQASNDTQVATTAFVKAAVAALVNGSPAALDTLQELANALGNDPNFSTTILNALSGKLAKDQNGADIPDKSQFRQNVGLGNVMMAGDFGWGSDAVMIPDGTNVQDYFAQSPASGVYRCYLPLGITQGLAAVFLFTFTKWNKNHATLIATSLGSDTQWMLQNTLQDGTWKGWGIFWNNQNVPNPMSVGQYGFGGFGAKISMHDDVFLPFLRNMSNPSQIIRNDEINSIAKQYSPALIMRADDLWTVISAGISPDSTTAYGGVEIATGNNDGTVTTKYQVWTDKNLLSPVTAAEIAGLPLPFPGAVAPAGWLKCNGQQFDTAQFPVLASRYPSGFLPDLRGEFVRGWDDGRGADAGRALLSAQSDAIRNIVGTIGQLNDRVNTTETAGVFDANRYTGSSAGLAGGQRGKIVTFDASKVVPTANENRPRNIAFNYIVRAA